jgi:hypothetical protein
MEEPYIEGVATHDGRELCVSVHEGVGEALAAVRAGWDIEPRKGAGSGCRRRHDRRKAISLATLCASRRRTLRGRRTCARTEPQ